MFNIFFSLGIPLFLLILYLIFWLIHKFNAIPYTGFILVIISGFLFVFSLEVLNRLIDFLRQSSSFVFSDQYGYSSNLLFLPIVIGFLLLLFSSIQLYKEWRH